MEQANGNGGKEGTPRSPIDALTARIEQLTARRNRLRAQERKRERGRETRRKIIMGALVIAMARNGDTAALAVVQRALSRVEPRDRGLFAGWKP